MNFTKILTTSYKSTLFCTIFIWSLNLLCFSSHIDIHIESIVCYFIISAIPIFIVIYLTILTTIYPIYFFEENNLNRNAIFKKYFPYYAIIFFGICVFVGVQYNQLFFINFLISAFLTAMLNWVWFFKKNIK